MYQQIKYFKGLNALRFFAAYLVVLHHAEQIRLKNGLFNLKGLPLFNNGGIAVTFFFVLSGFLISYLLLKEQRETNTVSIKKFYARRMLRIWPLYYLLVFIGTLIVPFFLGLIGHSYEMPYAFKDVILYYIFFSPFMVNVLFGHHFLEPLWSIGVEEVFYILWAPMFKFLRNYLLEFIVSIISIKIIILGVIEGFSCSGYLFDVIRMLQFEALAIGGLAAYLIFHRNKPIESSFLCSVPFQLLASAFILFRIFAAEALSKQFLFLDYLYNTPVLSALLLICAFAWLIVNVSINPKSLIRLDHSLLNFLGNISYGIYMYHMLIIFGLILVFKKQLAPMQDLTGTVLFYLVLTGAVVLVSFVSKKVFEDYFLNLKGRFRAGKKI